MTVTVNVYIVLIICQPLFQMTHINSFNLQELYEIRTIITSIDQMKKLLGTCGLLAGGRAVLPPPWLPVMEQEAGWCW